MAGIQTRVVCPNCGLSRMESAFNRGDDGKGYGVWEKGDAIIQLRSQVGGKPSKEWVGSGHYRKSVGPGFPMVDSFDLTEAKGMDEYSKYIEMIAEQTLKVCKILYDEKLITAEDINSIL